MSGIYIHGMEMPKSCSRCVLFDEGSNGDPDWCNVMHQVPEYETCPLVPITPHGRLIDADAFLALINDSTILSDFLKCIINPLIRGEPTIIPASEIEQETK